MLIAPAPRDDEAPTFDERRYSEKYSCPYDGFTIDELEPRSFSFNSPHGACPACTGLGTKLEIDPALVIPDRSKSLATGALVPWAKMPTDASWRLKILEAICAAHGWDFKAPIRDLPPEAVKYVLYARQGGEGRRPLPARARREHVQRHVRGRRHQPRTALPGDRLGLHQDRAREVHGHPARARPAAGSGCGPRSSASPSASATSGTCRRCRSPMRCAGPTSSTAA